MSISALNQSSIESRSVHDVVHTRAIYKAYLVFIVFLLRSQDEMRLVAWSSALRVLKCHVPYGQNAMQSKRIHHIHHQRGEIPCGGE